MKVIVSNEYIEIPEGDTDMLVKAHLKLMSLAKPESCAAFRSHVPLGFYSVMFDYRDNMARGYKKMWDWMRGDFVESRIEWNMDEVEVNVDSETEIEVLPDIPGVPIIPEDSLYYCGVIVSSVDGRKIARNGYLPMSPCRAAGSQF